MRWGKVKAYLMAIGHTLFAYWFNTLYILDVAANVLIGGDRRETISSRLGKGKLTGKPVHTILSYGVDALFLVALGQRQHCVKNIQNLGADIHSVSSVWDQKIDRYMLKYHQ